MDYKQSATMNPSGFVLLADFCDIVNSANRDL